ncbi:hypothetical protein AD936_20165 [Gluconobacter japonicus]|nr:hypothetical protein AD936_20165 [Gluconobacter japonicus]
MIHEMATIFVKNGDEAPFENAAYQAAEIFKAARGCLGMHLQRSVENRSKYLLIIEWSNLEDHMEIFRKSEGFKRWRELVGVYFDKSPNADHTEICFDFSWEK